MTEYSEEYRLACAAWVEEVITQPRGAFTFLTEKITPQSASHFDPRMHLTLADMPAYPPWANPEDKKQFPLIIAKY